MGTWMNLSIEEETGKALNFLFRIKSLFEGLNQRLQKKDYY